MLQAICPLIVYSLILILIFDYLVFTRITQKWSFVTLFCEGTTAALVYKNVRWSKTYRQNWSKMARLSELYVWPNMNHVQCHVVARSEERNSGAYVTQTKLNTQIDSIDFSDPFNQRIDPSKTKIDSKIKWIIYQLFWTVTIKMELESWKIFLQIFCRYFLCFDLLNVNVIMGGKNANPCVP